MNLSRFLHFRVLVPVFVLPLIPASVSAPTSMGITTGAATFGGTIVNNEGTITERGGVLARKSENDDPRLGGTRVTMFTDGATGDGVFTDPATGLKAGSDYVFKAYVIASGFTSYSASATFSTLDTNVDGSKITAATPLPDGKILVAGSFSSFGGEAHDNIARLHPSGSVDPTFTYGHTGFGDLTAVSVQDDGKILVSGFGFLERFDSSGTVDPTFNASVDSGNINAVAPQPDGKIVIGGTFLTVNSVSRSWLARLNANGTTDGDFDLGDPFNSPNNPVNSIVIQPDGKILIGGLFETVQGVARKGIARLQANGILDTSFDPGIGTDASVFSIAVQTDGKILIGGAFQNVNGTARQRIARLTETGAVDTSFNPGAAANDLVTGVALQPDGKMLVSGYFSGGITRLTTTGAPDPAFTPGSGANDRIYTTALQTDGKILIGGIFTGYNGTPINRIARLSANGALDATFDPGSGADDEVDAVALAEDGSLYLGGLFQNVDGTAISGLARLDNDAATETLTVVDGTALTWQRGGAGPEIPQADFEISTDGGTTWTDLATPTRVAGGWSLAGQILPRAGRIRSQGKTAGGFLGGSSGVVEETVVFDHNAKVAGLRTSLNASIKKEATLAKQLTALKKKKKLPKKLKAKQTAALNKQIKAAKAATAAARAQLVKYP